ncbi:MAG TPA: glycoside hydrolase family 48 protein, partial [Clostridia bacterium]
EAPDYGHESTSEAASYYLWLEAMNGKFTGDFSGYKKAWDILEKYYIPSKDLQPGIDKYDANSPASYADEYELPDKYPSKLVSGSCGKDPLSSQVTSAYGTGAMYGMHWIIDADNWYGFGIKGDGKGQPAWFNTFQRGQEESTWETIPQPSWELMNFGGKNGYLDLFTVDSSYSKQWKYTEAPDADARAIQASWWANKYAKDAGVDLSTYNAKAAKMGDFMRYSLFDKFFRKVGSPKTLGTGYDSCLYLQNWYYGWGGAYDGTWAWKEGCSHVHFGYQNPMAAYVLSTDSAFKPKSSQAATDWSKTLKNELDLYKWLQSSEGAIAGGCTNSWNGRYETIPSGVSTFNGMAYVAHPVYADPGSNEWPGMQTWSMQRVAEYAYLSKDTSVIPLLTKWADWLVSNITFENGTFQIPTKLGWEGQPDTWTGTSTGNPNLHCTVLEKGQDLGTAANMANALTFISAATGDEKYVGMSVKLLEAIWRLKDSKGVSVKESRKDYHRFFDQEVYVPAGYSGKMPNGDAIKPGIKFIDIRTKYKQDPDWSKIEAYQQDSSKVPEFSYHRFWAQCDMAVALANVAILFPYGDFPPPPTPSRLNGDLNTDGKINSTDVSILKRVILGIFTGSYDKTAADVNSDGKINSTDYSLLKRVILNRNS